MDQPSADPCGRVLEAGRRTAGHTEDDGAMSVDDYMALFDHIFGEIVWTFVGLVICWLCLR